MNFNSKMYCNNIGTYFGQLTKRKRYDVLEINSEFITIESIKKIRVIMK